MSAPPTAWDVLGIAPTSDPQAIKRAYATRLKVTSPEDNPEGFKVLRAALEWALRHGVSAASRASLQRPAPAGPRSTPRPSSTPASAAGVASTSNTGLHESPAPESVVEIDARKDLQEAQTAFNTLYQLLMAPQPPGEVQLHAAWSRIVNSDATRNVLVQSQMERSLAHLLTSYIPRSDALLSTAVREFHWEHQENAVSADPAVLGILRRLRDLAWLENLKSAGHPLRDAYVVLKNPPRPRMMQVYLFLSRVDVRVAQLLHTIQRERPGIRAHFNSESLEWWSTYLKRPRLTRPLITCFAIFGLLSGLFTSAQQPSGRLQQFFLDFAVITGTGVVLALLKLWAIDFLRGVWLSRGAPKKSLLLEYAWSPVSVVCLALALSLPGLRYLPAVVLILGLACILWLYATARPQKRFSVVARSSDVSWHFVHTFVAIAHAMVWRWLVEADPSKAVQTFIAVTVFAVTHEFANEALYISIWQRLRQRTRYMLLAAQAVAATLIGASLLSGTLIPGFHSPVPLVVLGPIAWLLVSAQRVPFLILSSDQVRHRFIAMAAAWLAYIVAGSTWSGAKNLDGDRMAAVTFVTSLLIGALLTAAMSAFNEYRAARHRGSKN